MATDAARRMAVRRLFEARAIYWRQYLTLFSQGLAASRALRIVNAIDTKLEALAED